MRVGDYSLSELAAHLSSDGLWLSVGPYVSRVRSTLMPIAEGLCAVSPYHYLVGPESYVDFDITITSPRVLPNPFERKLHFLANGTSPFEPLPTGQAYALFEWGLNWCIAQFSGRFLLIHSAVVEKNGQALMLPAPSGSGKSTLCAALVCRGWRLLSDELGILRMDGKLIPIPRPVSLKNASIDIIREFEPAAVIGGRTDGTPKGVVAYMRPPIDSVDRQFNLSAPRWVIFPSYSPGAHPQLSTYSKARTLVYLAHNSFNYHIHGVRGFKLLGNILDHCDCYTLNYGSLEDALACIDSLAETTSPTIPSAA